MVKFLLLLFTLSSFAACQTAETRKQDVLGLKEMGELATTSYTITKIVKANDNKTWYKIGDRKILISCKATIKAGIDLSKLTDDQIVVSGDQIKLYLQPPHLISLNMLPNDIKVEHEEIGVFRQGFSNADRDQLLAQAETQIKSSIADLGILKTSEDHTRLFLTKFLQNAGFRDVQIIFGNRPGIS
jgi:Protein of unknown function (DUF4230)